MSAVTGARALRGRELHAEAIADVRLRDLGGSDARSHSAWLECNPPVISGLPGVWYGAP